MTASARLLAALFATAASITPALAAEAQGPEIVVTGQGLDDTPAVPAYDVQDISRDRLVSTASGRIEDALAAVAGFQQFRRSDSRAANPSAQGVTLRALGGNATSRALVLLDGVPMADPFFGYVPLSALAPERLAAVRVTRGGGSGAFGAGAVAGTIELTSADAATLGLIAASALANQRGESELSATLAPQLGQGFVIASGRWDRGRGFWTTPRGQRVAASSRARFDAWSAGLRGVAPLAPEIELQARVLAFDDARTLRFDGAETTSSGQDASLRLVGRGPWQFDVLGYVQARDFSNVVISASSFRKTLDQRRTPSTGLGGKLELRPPVGGGHVLRLGTDWRQASGTMQEEPYSPMTGLVTARRRAGGRNGDLGLFVEDDWALGDLVLTGGVRADRWSIRSGRYRELNAAGVTVADTRFPERSGWSTSLRGGAVWRAGGGLSLRAAAYTGLRLPTLNELYRAFTVTAPAPGGGVASTTTLANAALGNERLRGIDLGLDYAPSEALRFSITAFHNRLRNAVANVTCKERGQPSACTTVSAAGLSNTVTYRERLNVAAVRARGLELSARVELGRLSFDGSLALTDAEMRGRGLSAALTGLRPAQTPKIAAIGTLGWRPREGWQIAATLRHTGMQFEDDQQTDRLAPATTVDAYAEVPLSSGIALVLRGENLANERVVTRKQGDSIDLGTPRTLWAGVKFRLGR